ncbi:hypothetical protein ACFLYO_09715 [Chloroflexota bacterium]
MSVLDDIIFYATLLTDVDEGTRNEAHAALRDIGEPSLLGIPAAVCHFRLPEQDLRETITVEVFETLQTIATDSVKQILDFLGNSEQAGDFWAEDVKTKAKAILVVLGEPPPQREKFPIAGIVTQFFIAFVASDNEEERAAAQTMLVNLGAENLEYFMEALENGNRLYGDEKKRERLYLFQHPRPQDLIATIQAMGTENARSALAWMGDPKKGPWDAQVAGWAKQAAAAMTEVKPDAWQSSYTKSYDYDHGLDNAEVRNCLVCGKAVPKGQGIKEGRSVFCSSAHHQQAKNNSSYRM